MIIVVANSKGGVGKSTVAAHLSAWLYEQGHSVCLADCDTQASSSEWIREAFSEIKAVRLNNPEEIIDELPDLGKQYDYVVADGPGSQNDTSRTLLMLADLAIVPVKASMLEVRALTVATKVLRHAQVVRKGTPPGVIVLCMVGKAHRLTQDMIDATVALQLPLASTHLTLRQAYADAPGQGTVVWKMGTRAGKASKEIQHLFQELLPQAVKKPRKLIAK
jgi:chromosome partitioning protein